jgi:biopolymer transport protein ExbB/TolQ
MRDYTMSDYILSDLYVKSGFTLIILIICFLFTFIIILRKWNSLNGLKENTIYDFKGKILSILEMKAPKDAIYFCYSYSTKKMFFKIKCPLSNVFIHILENTSMDKEELLTTANFKIQYELIKNEKGLRVLSALGIISPLIGLTGTLIGIIFSFEILSANGASSWPAVMGDIAVSLISTVAGFIIAIVAVIFNIYFSKQLKLAKYFMEDSSFELIRQLKSSNKIDNFQYIPEV